MNLSFLLKWISPALALIWEFVKPLLISSAGRVTAKALKIALNIVTDVEQTTSLPGPDKYDLARDEFIDALRAEQIILADRTINWLLETAVQKIKPDTALSK